MSKLKFYRLVLTLFFVMIGVKGNCQMNLEFTSINEYSFSTKDVLNLLITNGYSKNFNVFIKGYIKDSKGQLVVEFKSKEVLLNSGANIITPISCSMMDIQFYNTDISEIEQATGTYPSGSYTVCLWTTCITNDCDGAGADAGSMEPKCINVHVENPTPLLLATPENEAEIDEVRPLYTWIPPSPVARSSNLNYKMILVEILDGQSIADALTQNRPIIETSGINNPALMHPSDMPELERGKWYAWQVEGNVGNTTIAKSEQWKFKVKKKEVQKRKIVYITMVNNQNVQSYEVNTVDSLALIFDQNYKISFEEKWLLTLKNEFDGAVVKLSFQQVDKRFNGLNSIKILPLEGINIELNKYYLLELVSAKGELFYARLIFKEKK